MPTIPVRYPAARNVSGSVQASTGIVSRAFGGSTRTPLRKPCTPVSSAKREGVQVPAAQCPSVNRSPSAASRSRLGVGIFSAP